MSRSKQDKKSRIKTTVEKILGEPVQDIQMPGGEGRASCRVVLRDRTVIATSRPNFRRTHLEAAVLRALSPACPNVPKFLGLQDNVLVQSDVGGKRLSQTIRATEVSDQAEQAVKAVSAILAIQHSARDALRDVPVPPLGQGPEWVAAHVSSIDVLSDFGTLEAIDRDEAARRLTVPSEQFLKWDCRSGNAALAADGTLCWFDFEYCGKRHGAEDIAWLIGDESWPIDAQTMFDIVETLLPAYGIKHPQAFMDYLALYTTFHAAQRLQLIVSETQRRGWRSKTKIIERDDVGRHPEFARNICAIGAFCADRSPLTRPLISLFDKGVEHFETVLNPASKMAAERGALKSRVTVQSGSSLC